jgi:hypothetical protein
MNRIKYCLLCSLIVFMSCANAQDKKISGTLKEMVAGDHACYVDFIDEQGQQKKGSSIILIGLRGFGIMLCHAQTPAN